MTDQPQSDPPPAIAAAIQNQAIETPPANSPEPGWRPEDDASGGPAAMAAERPEIAIGASFAGGLVLALILKRLAR